MLKFITGFPMSAYNAFCGFVRDIRKDERGLSGVVVAILLILVAVLAIVLIWGFLSGWITELWDHVVASGTLQQA